MKKKNRILSLFVSLSLLFLVVALLVILKNCIPTESPKQVLNSAFNFSTEVPRYGSCAFTSDLL